jgi:hypothetical protein
MKSPDPGDLLVSLAFLKWQSLYELEKPFQLFVNIPPDAKDQRTTNLVFEKSTVPICDVRDIDMDWSIDKKGFIYRRHLTEFKDFENRSAVENVYLPQVEALLKKELDGVDRIFFFDWRVSFLHP